MKNFIFVISLSIYLFANVTLWDIENSIDRASEDFRLQKREHNITKLLKISKILYNNNKILKKLREKNRPKISLVFIHNTQNIQPKESIELDVQTRHNPNETYEKSLLNLYIYNKQDTILKEKEIELYEDGGTHHEKFKFKIDKPGKDYKICAIFNEDDKEYSTCKKFQVTESIEIKDIIISTDSHANRSDSVFLPKRELYIFLPFKSKTTSPISGNITIKDGKKIVLSKYFTKEYIPTNEFRKVKILLPGSLIYPNQTLHVEISLESKEFEKIVRKSDIDISSYKLIVNFPDVLTSTKSEDFSITPPKNFKRPFRIDIRTNGAIVIGHKKDALSGTISSITNKNDTAYVNIDIKDAKNREIQKRVKISLLENKTLYKTEIKKSKETIRQQIKIGSTKSFDCHGIHPYDYTKYTGKCTGIYDGKRWIMHGKYRLYYINNKKDTSKLYEDIYEKKGSLAVKAQLKNGKLDGKYIEYYGNGNIKYIKHYKNGKFLPNNSIGYFLNSKIRSTSKQNLHVELNKKGVVYQINEKLRNNYSIKSDGFDYESINSLYLFDSDGKELCAYRFENRKLNSIACYYDGKKIVGKKDIGSFGKVTSHFYSKGGKECTRRFNNKDKINQCKRNYELAYIDKEDKANLALKNSQAFQKYLKNYNFNAIVYFRGETIYYTALQKALYNSTYISPYLSNQCKKYKNRVKNAFIYFNGSLKKSKHLYIDMVRTYKHGNPSKKLVKIFAKRFFRKRREKYRCYMELRSYYMQMGYL